MKRKYKIALGVLAVFALFVFNTITLYNDSIRFEFPPYCVMLYSPRLEVWSIDGRPKLYLTPIGTLAVFTNNDN
jgi:hypothetical protein